jgi:hypothetical protein
MKKEIKKWLGTLWTTSKSVLLELETNEKKKKYIYMYLPKIQ